MIRALVYTDLQATEGPERCYNDPGMPLQRFRVVNFYRRLFAIYQQYSCNSLWDLGDTTDDRTAIPLPTIQCVSKGLQPFRDGKLNIKLSGNHEQYTRNTEIDNSELFCSVFKVVKDVQAFELENVVIIGVGFPASMAQTMEQIDSMLLRYRNKQIIVLGHLEIAGTKMNSGISLVGMPSELFEPAAMTLLGHVHIPQQVGKSAFYVGSPFQQDFGEAGESKRLGLVTIDSDIITLEWIPLEGFPQYQYVSWDEFNRVFDEKSENRYSVKITSPEEAELFFKHPYSGRARVEYDYQIMNPELPNSDTAPADWNLHAAAKKWLEVCDPAEKNISIPPEELLAFGIQIAESSGIR